MLGSETSFWFSESGSSLAFLRLDDTAVDWVSYQETGGPGRAGFKYSKVCTNSVRV